MKIQSQTKSMIVKIVLLRDKLKKHPLEEENMKTNIPVIVTAVVVIQIVIHPLHQGPIQNPNLQSIRRWQLLVIAMEVGIHPRLLKMWLLKRKGQKCLHRQREAHHQDERVHHQGVHRQGKGVSHQEEVRQGKGVNHQEGVRRRGKEVHHQEEGVDHGRGVCHLGEGVHRQEEVQRQEEVHHLGEGTGLLGEELLQGMHSFRQGSIMIKRNLNCV